MATINSFSFHSIPYTFISHQNLTIPLQIVHTQVYRQVVNDWNRLPEDCSNATRVNMLNCYFIFFISFYMDLCWVQWCDHVRIKIIISIIINLITAVYFRECITNFILYTT